jgi:hypothetical protein
MGHLVCHLAVYSPSSSAPPVIKHVKGHQDKTAPIATVPLAAQLNCEADALATTALAAIPSLIPLAAVFPSAVWCQLDVGEATVTRHLQSTLWYVAAAPNMI